MAALDAWLAACGAGDAEGGRRPATPDPARPWSRRPIRAAGRPDGRARPNPCTASGRSATESQIAAWDIDIGPDGAGLPPGRGSVAEGLEVWERHRCILCHGPTGREGPNDIITGRIPGDEFPFANDRSLRSTVGNYWPYATTLFDYTRRAMPFDLPGTMTDEEVYAVVGAMLYFNDLLPADAVVDSAMVVDTRMPARDRFVPDNRTGGPTIR